MKTASELAASVDRNAPFSGPYEVKAGTLDGPVEMTIPVRKPMIVPATASCYKPMRKLRVSSQ
jgi:hypothetical protein